MDSKRILNLTILFAVVFCPLIVLSFLAHTPFHQSVLFAGFLIALGAGYYVSGILQERDRLNREIFMQVYELRKAKEALNSCLVFDGKTNVYSERLLTSRITEECDRARRYRRPLSFLLVGLDDFERIQRDHGMLCSEVLAQEVIQFVKESMRGVDVVIREGVSRVVAVLPETAYDPARVAAERIRYAVEKKVFRIEEKPIKLTVSVGLVSFDSAVHRSKDDVLRELDLAVKEANKQGPNHVGILPNKET